MLRNIRWTKNDTVDDRQYTYQDQKILVISEPAYEN